MAVQPARRAYAPYPLESGVERGVFRSPTILSPRDTSEPEEESLRGRGGGRGRGARAAPAADRGRGAGGDGGDADVHRHQCPVSGDGVTEGAASGETRMGGGAECRLRRARQARGGAGKRGGGGEQARRSGGGGGGGARAARAAEGRRGGGATAAVDTCWRVARVGGGRGWLFSAHRLRARALVQLQAGPSARSFVRGRSTPWSHLRGIVYDDRPHDSPGALSAARLPTRAHNYAHGSPE